MRWWGWGEDGHVVPIPDAAAALLREVLGTDGSIRRRPVALDQVRLPEPRLPAAARERLAEAVGTEHVREDREARVAHATGRSYPDLVRLRSGDGSSAPDAVVLPGSAEQIAAVLAAPDAETVTVTANGSSATAVISRQRSEIVFVSRGLPDAPADRTYQAWMIGPSGARSAGLLGPTGQRPLILRGPADATALGVTIEPARGSRQPTSDPVLLLELPKA